MVKVNENSAEVIGKLACEFSFNHTIRDKNFYRSALEVERPSGRKDIIPIIIDSKLLSDTFICPGDILKAKGAFRSYNYLEGNKNRLDLFLSAKEICISDENEKNQISIDGYICKEPNYRRTPKGRYVSDLLVAVNRKYGKTDYIPCIAWKKNAATARKLAVGDHILINGRIQSREYIKNEETKIAYEVCIKDLEVLEDEN